MKRRQFEGQEIRCHPMVGWFDYEQLLTSAQQVAISTILGEHADRRFLETLFDPDGLYYDCRFAGAPIRFNQKDDQTGAGDQQKRQEFWFDYVADVGDGFNSTFSVAHTLGRPEIEIEGQSLPRGEMLVFGGDEVYPAADRAFYEEKLETPYSIASKQGGDVGEQPSLFAIPGNHDWYDSLNNFTRLFCENETFASGIGRGWRCPQDKSYFVLRLPQRWWLVGVDTQLTSDLDIGQLRYLKRMAAEMAPGDQIILCCSEPYWIYAQMYGVENKMPQYLSSHLTRRYLEDEIFVQQKIRVYLSGDQHHYQRFSGLVEGEECHRITSGGGGAFLHPTWVPDQGLTYEQAKSRQAIHYQHRTCYPTPQTCAKLGNRVVWFCYLNPQFMVVTGVIYGLLGWFLLSSTAISVEGKALVFTPKGAFLATFLAFFRTPWLALLALAASVGVYLFTDTVPSYRKFSAVHAFLHLSGMTISSWTVFFLVNQLLPPYWPALERILSGAQAQFAQIFVVFGWPLLSVTYEVLPLLWPVLNLILTGYLVSLLGAFVGTNIFGLYLWVSYRFFGRHSNEAFSALRIEDYKNFLRLHITPEGDLEIFPVAIPKVCRHWDQELQPKQPIEHHLIEEKIVIGRARTG